MLKQKLHKHEQVLSENNRSGSGKAYYHNESVHLRIKKLKLNEKKIPTRRISLEV